MTTLPSFVELMASLGLNQSSAMEELPSSPTSSASLSPPLSPSLYPCQSLAGLPLSTSLHSRTPSREHNLTCRIARYTPYDPALSPRRGSLPSLSPMTSEFNRHRSYSLSPQPTMSALKSGRRPPEISLSMDLCDDTPYLSANTPISAYVRRKTPGTPSASPSPVSSHFESSPLFSALPLSIPSLPPLFSQPSPCDSLPPTPDGSEIEAAYDDFPSSAKHFHYFTKPDFPRSRSYRGVRISTPAHPPDSFDRRGTRQICIP